MIVTAPVVFVCVFLVFGSILIVADLYETCYNPNSYYIYYS